MISDDWHFVVRSTSIPAWFGSAIDLNRPGQWLIHALQFRLLGDNRVAHALVLAAAGALVAVLLFECVRREFGDAVGICTALIWGSLPMVSTIRYWAATTPTLISIALLLWGFLGISGRTDLQRRDFARLGTALGLAALTYEAGVPMGLSLLLYVWWKRSSRQWGTLAMGVLAPAIALSYNALRTPKEVDGRILFEFAPDAPKALFGHGLLPESAGPVGALLIAVPAAVVAMAILPGFRKDWHRQALLGLWVAATGISVFAAVGFPIVSRGIMDRSAAVSSLGVALFYGALLGAVLASHRAAGVLALATLCVGLNVTNLAVSGEVQMAESDWVEIIDRLAFVDPDADVIVQIPGRSGWVGGIDGDQNIAAEATGRSIPRRVEVVASDSIDDIRITVRSGSP